MGADVSDDATDNMGVAEGASLIKRLGVTNLCDCKISVTRASFFMLTFGSRMHIFRCEFRAG